MHYIEKLRTLKIKLLVVLNEIYWSPFISEVLTPFKYCTMKILNKINSLPSMDTLREHHGLNVKVELDPTSSDTTKHN